MERTALKKLDFQKTIGAFWKAVQGEKEQEEAGAGAEPDAENPKTWAVRIKLNGMKSLGLLEALISDKRRGAVNDGMDAVDTRGSHPFQYALLIEALEKVYKRGEATDQGETEFDETLFEALYKCLEEFADPVMTTVKGNTREEGREVLKLIALKRLLLKQHKGKEYTVGFSRQVTSESLQIPAYFRCTKSARHNHSCVLLVRNVGESTEHWRVLAPSATIELKTKEKACQFSRRVTKTNKEYLERPSLADKDGALSQGLASTLTDVWTSLARRGVRQNSEIPERIPFRLLACSQAPIESSTKRKRSDKTHTYWAHGSLRIPELCGEKFIYQIDDFGPFEETPPARAAARIGVAVGAVAAGGTVLLARRQPPKSIGMEVLAVAAVAVGGAALLSQNVGLGLEGSSSGLQTEHTGNNDATCTEEVSASMQALASYLHVLTQGVKLLNSYDPRTSKPYQISGRVLQFGIHKMDKMEFLAAPYTGVESRESWGGMVRQGELWKGQLTQDDYESMVSGTVVRKLAEKESIGDGIPVIIKVSTRTVFNTLMQAGSYSYCTQIACWNDVVRNDMKSTLLCVYRQTHGSISVLRDLGGGYSDLQPRATNSSRLKLWEHFSKFVLEKLLPLASFDIVHCGLRAGWDWTSNIMAKSDGSEMEMIDMESLCTVKEVPMPNDERYAQQPPENAYAYVATQCISLAYVWSTQSRQSSAPMSAVESNCVFNSEPWTNVQCQDVERLLEHFRQFFFNLPATETSGLDIGVAVDILLEARSN